MFSLKKIILKNVDKSLKHIIFLKKSCHYHLCLSIISGLQKPLPWLSSEISTDLVAKSLDIWMRNLVIKLRNPGKSSWQLLKSLFLHCFIWKLRKFVKLATSDQDGFWTQQCLRIVTMHSGILPVSPGITWWSICNYKIIWNSIKTFP